jgi:acyl carrier protein
MTVSSRTPEGEPHGCPICGQVANLDPAEPGGDSVCPSCGYLLWQFRDALRRRVRIEPTAIRPNLNLADIGLDSLDTIELIMELEEELDLELSDTEAERIKTVGDALRLIEERLRESKERKT